MTNTKTHKEAIADALNDFVAYLQKEEIAYWAEQDAKSDADLMSLASTFSVMKGRKYARIVSNSGSQRSAFCFVDLNTGDVLKSATWKAPAKHARGSIFADDPSGYGVTRYGAHYLR